MSKQELDDDQIEVDQGSQGSREKEAQQPTDATANEIAEEASAQAAKAVTVESYFEEGELICASLEKTFRGACGDMPSQGQLAEIHGYQASIRDLIRRTAESGAGATEDLNRLTKERDAFKDAATRAKADFLNYQERAKRDLNEAEEHVLRGYVSDLLPILDSLDLAVADAQSELVDADRIRSALTMIASGLGQALAVRGLERIAAKGKTFVPNLHEAVSKRPADASKGELSNQVVEELRAGYTWKGKLLRPCQVLTTQAAAG